MQSALSAHSADCCYYRRLSFHCGNLRSGSDFPSPVRVLVRYCQGDITDCAYVVADEEDASTADLVDVVDSKVLGNDRIDRKAEGTAEDSLSLAVVAC